MDKKKNISDFILDFLVSKGVKKVFLLTGGAIAFLVDSFHKRKDISYICVQHEQAAAMMADAYSRIGPNFAATLTTSGPGATNLITGIACSFFDSIPNIHITGQVNTYEQRGSMKGTSHSRQIGFQENDIVSISKPITKLSTQLTNAKNIKYLLEKLYYVSQEGRQGPVLLDIPMNFQKMEISTKLKSFKPKIKKQNNSNFLIKLNKVINLLNNSKRPVLISGGGIRYSNSVSQLNQFIKLLKIPAVTTWSGIDTIASDNKHYISHIGVYGSRAANFAIQNSDVVLSLGSRLDTRITGGKPGTFARKAKIIMVDIDQGELSKRRGLKPYIEFKTDVNFFVEKIIKKISYNNIIYREQHKKWLKKCTDWKKIYPTVSKDFSTINSYVNPYLFIEELSKHLNKGDIIIPDDGAHLTWFMQAFKVKLGQRIFSAFGFSPMGYALPACIGASIASNKKRVICIDGDGSLQINMQELQTIVNEKLPIKIFIMNNFGYGILKQFQDMWLGSRYEASDKGVSVPKYKNIAGAYRIKYISIKQDKLSKKVINKVLKKNEPYICEVFLNPNQKIIPKLSFGSPIEDLSPLLPRSEFNNNMLIATIKSDKKLKEI